MGLATTMRAGGQALPVEEKSVVAIRPKPAFRPLFEVATTREGSDEVLINEPPLANEPEAANSCFWWRCVRVDLHPSHGLAVLVAATCGDGPTALRNFLARGTPALKLNRHP